MASLHQEASGALSVQHSVSSSFPRMRDDNTRLEEEFVDLLAQYKYCFAFLKSEQCLSSRGFECKHGSVPIVYRDRLRIKLDF